MIRDKPVIVLVDDDAVNLTIGKNILKDKYAVFPINTAESFFQILPNLEVDLILLDIEMPDVNGYETIKRLKTDPEYADIPVIFLTAKNDPGSELEGLSLGAIDYVSKPFSPPLLVKRIENHLAMREATRKLKAYNDDLLKKVDTKTNEVNELQNAILRVVAELVEFRNDANNGHIERTQKYIKLFLDKMIEKGTYHNEVSKWNLEYLIPAAQLYDVGKIAISDMLLNKPAKFSPEEFELMKQHTIFGVAAIKEIEKQTKQNLFLYYAKIFAGTHHEKWDGTGYPRKLKGVDIPLPGRIMAIIDVYDSLTSVRPYRKAISHTVAERVIIGSAGINFDPALIEIFKFVVLKFSEIADEAK
ncbi:MAG: response regulator [Spirochaetaceae bacterium]|jgi:putative two-component system response regulator|nr:response regulator [Spirochaetaceae bacterium]